MTEPQHGDETGIAARTNRREGILEWHRLVALIVDDHRDTRAGAATTVARPTANPCDNEIATAAAPIE